MCSCFKTSRNLQNWLSFCCFWKRCRNGGGDLLLLGFVVAECYANVVVFWNNPASDLLLVLSYCQVCSLFSWIEVGSLWTTLGLLNGSNYFPLRNKIVWHCSFPFCLGFFVLLGREPWGQLLRALAICPNWLSNFLKDALWLCIIASFFAMYSFNKCLKGFDYFVAWALCGCGG